MEPATSTTFSQGRGLAPPRKRSMSCVVAHRPPGANAAASRPGGGDPMFDATSRCCEGHCRIQFLLEGDPVRCVDIPDQYDRPRGLLCGGPCSARFWRQQSVDASSSTLGCSTKSPHAQAGAAPQAQPVPAAQPPAATATRQLKRRLAPRAPPRTALEPRRPRRSQPHSLFTMASSESVSTPEHQCQLTANCPGPGRPIFAWPRSARSTRNGINASRALRITDR